MMVQLTGIKERELHIYIKHTQLKEQIKRDSELVGVKSPEP